MKTREDVIHAVIEEINSNPRKNRKVTQYELLLNSLLSSGVNGVEFSEVNKLLGNPKNLKSSRSSLISRLKEKLERHGYTIDKKVAYHLVQSQKEE